MPVSNDAEASKSTLRSQREQIAGLIRGGQPAAAFEHARAATLQFPDDARLQYLHALALARGGNPSNADRFIKKLLGRSDLSPGLRVDALSLSARLYKDHYARGEDASSQQSSARKSAELYLMAYKITGDPFPGINAATMLCISGADKEKVKQLASEVKQAVASRVADSDQPFWMLATLGEACLLLGEFRQSDEDNDCAEYWYQQAVEKAGRDSLGDVATMRRQAHMLQQYIDVPESVFEVMETGVIAVFSGHMIDNPGWVGEGKPPRFPPDIELEVSVAAQINKAIKALDVREAFVSVACGSDLLFAERMLAAHRRVHIVLPFSLEDFYRRSVDFGRSDEYWQSWRSRCDHVLEMAGDDIHYASTERDYGGNIMFQFQNQFSQGLAIQRAAQLDLEPWAIVVEDVSDHVTPGGTEDFAAEWAGRGDRFAANVQHIDLKALRNAAGYHDSGSENPTKGVPQAGSGSLPYSGALGLYGAEDMTQRSMLFADVSGFSSLRDDQANIFFIQFSEKVAALIREFPAPPVFQNSWGDGLFFAFDRPEDCADFALALIDIPGSTDFESLGLPADLTIRVGIHTGPVFVLHDPIIEKKNMFGAHVNRAARIEPVTIPGCVYASEHMAAILAGSKGHRYILEYVGVADLAKGYDRCPLYQLSRN